MTGMRENRAFRGEGQTVYTAEALTPSNSFVGSSQVLARIYRERTLGADDLVLDLVGGRFVLLAGERALRPVRFGPAQRHPFERGGNEEGIPAALEEEPYQRMGLSPLRLERIDAPPAGAVPWGGLPDWLVPAGVAVSTLGAASA